MFKVLRLFQLHLTKTTKLNESPNLTYRQIRHKSTERNPMLDVIQSSKEAQIALGILDGSITKETHPHIDIESYTKRLSINLADPESVKKNYDALKKAHDQSGGFYW